jgi:chromosome segregation ATPase
MDRDEENNRLLGSVNKLQELLSSLNDELESSDQAIDSLESDVESLKTEIKTIKNRLRELELNFSERKGRDSVRDPKLEKLPDREKLNKKLNNRVNYRTVFIIGSIITFFVSTIGTGLTILIMLYTGAIGG